MSVVATKWNVVIVGAWNRAIFTPAWIQEHVFGLRKDTPVEVQVPLDVLAPFRIKHAGLTVVPSSTHIDIECDRPEDGLLGGAFRAARTVLEQLPKTPVTAAGVNLRFDVGDAPTGFITAVMENELDKKFSAKYVIHGIQRRWSLKHGDGVLNCAVTEKTDTESQEQSWSVGFNYHIETDDKTKMNSWLNQDVAKLRGKSEEILKQIMQLKTPSEGDDE